MRLAFKCSTIIADPDTVYVTYTAALGRKRRTVDFKGKNCSCLGWQQDSRTCPHALAGAQVTKRLECDVVKA